MAIFFEKMKIFGNFFAYFLLEIMLVYACIMMAANVTVTKVLNDFSLFYMKILCYWYFMWFHSKSFTCLNLWHVLLPPFIYIIHIKGIKNTFVVLHIGIMCDAHTVPEQHRGTILLTFILFCCFFCVFVTLTRFFFFSGMPQYFVFTI